MIVAYMKTWFISDTHFYHTDILHFIDATGKPIRGSFFSLEHMHEEMIKRWNAAVDPGDKIYHLGDVLMGTSAWKFQELMPLLNGEKILIKGNHDDAKLSILAQYFKDVRSEIHRKTPDGDVVLFTHRPVYLEVPEIETQSSRVVFNVHGHIHQHVLKDPRYINICVEQTEYAPISWSTIVERVQSRKVAMKGQFN